MKIPMVMLSLVLMMIADFIRSGRILTVRGHDLKPAEENKRRILEKEKRFFCVRCNAAEAFLVLREKWHR